MIVVTYRCPAFTCVATKKNTLHPYFVDKQYKYKLLASKYETNVMRNNVIVDMIEKMTNNPFIFNDDTEDDSIVNQNKEIASFYACVIITCILYIVIVDWLDKDGT